jgi:DNA-binding transcriptional ArsR family regulator
MTENISALLGRTLRSPSKYAKRAWERCDHVAVRSARNGGTAVDESDEADVAVAAIAAAIGEPARVRMLYRLLDDRARTATELALVAGVSPSTASAHLGRLTAEGLVQVRAQGKHRYYRLADVTIARALETLSVLAGSPDRPFKPHTPDCLRAARTCYDPIAGRLGVALHDALMSRRWLQKSSDGANDYVLAAAGAAGLTRLGIDVDAVRSLRRRFAFGCLDWSERRLHVGGALGAALLKAALDQRWVIRESDGRALRLTSAGRDLLLERMGVDVSAG